MTSKQARFRKSADGAVAQLVERVVRNDEARGSIPLGSTMKARCAEVTFVGDGVKVVPAGVIPGLRHFGIGLIPWSPIGMGLLGGALGNIETGRRATPALQGQIDQHRPQLEKYEALCNEIGEAPAVVALAWLLNNPVVTAAISGVRTVE